MYILGGLIANATFDKLYHEVGFVTIETVKSKWSTWTKVRTFISQLLHYIFIYVFKWVAVPLLAAPMKKEHRCPLGKTFRELSFLLPLTKLGNSNVRATSQLTYLGLKTCCSPSTSQRNTLIPTWIYYSTLKEQPNITVSSKIWINSSTARIVKRHECITAVTVCMDSFEKTCFKSINPTAHNTVLNASSFRAKKMLPSVLKITTSSWKCPLQSTPTSKVLLQRSTQSNQALKNPLLRSTSTINRADFHTLLYLKLTFTLNHPSYIVEKMQSLSFYSVYKKSRNISKKLDLINCISNNTEKYISFSIDNLDFIDSLQFMNASLEKLVSNLAKDGVDKFSTLKKYMDSDKVPLLLRKGVYPYDYMNCVERFQEPTLPPKESFYNVLNDEHISDED